MDRKDLSADYYAKTELWAHIYSLEYVRRIQGQANSRRDSNDRSLLRMVVWKYYGRCFQGRGFENDVPVSECRTPEDGARAIVLTGTYARKSGAYNS